MDYQQQYSNYLMQQFINARGLDTSKNSTEIASEFKLWLELQKQHLRLYNQVLKKLKVPYDDFYCAEIGKGINDSAVLNQTSTTIITPYIENYEEIAKNIVLPFDTKLVDGKLVLNNEKETKIVSGFERYMTQNPYTPSHLDGWARFHFKNQAITVGVYGKITDKDRDQKLKQIKDLKEQLDSNIIYLENEIYQDTYVSIVSSKPKELEKVL